MTIPMAQVQVFMVDRQGISILATTGAVVLANLVLSQTTEPNISEYRLDYLFLI